METGGYNCMYQDTPETDVGKTARKPLKLLCFTIYWAYVPLKLQHLI